ncbi:JAB domain-containing protein [Gudongella sp. SC589]|uniref:JAB domain-containing protein n=1 Tax=Gudongella sp. SC589 TaxID=3385990 RepID=UPI00390484FF
MTNLYKTFGCDTREELYEKMKLGVDEVRPLLEFLDYAKMSIMNKGKNISSSTILFETVSKITPPTKDSARIIFVDTKNRPVHLCKMRLSQIADIKRAISEGLSAGAANLFIATHENSKESRVDNFVDLSESIRLRVVDRLTYSQSNEEYTSHGARDSYQLDENPEIIKETQNKVNMTYTQLDKFNEYAEFFARQELKGLNIIEDIELIKEKMKLGFQFEQQEVLGYLSYDQDNNVINLNPQFKGGVNSSIIDPRIILKDLLREENMKGFILFHNHPSGKTTPSREDLMSTQALYEGIKRLNIEMADHFIVAKEGVLSFVEEVETNSFSNIEYLDKIAEVKEATTEYRGQATEKVEVKPELSHKNDLKTILNELMEQDYESFVKSLISIEKGINDDVILIEMYEKYMESDATLLNDLFDDIEFDLEQGNDINNVISDDLIREKPMKVKEMEKKEDNKEVGAKKSLLGLLSEESNDTKNTTDKIRKEVVKSMEI